MLTIDKSFFTSKKGLRPLTRWNVSVEDSLYIPEKPIYWHSGHNNDLECPLRLSFPREIKVHIIYYATYPIIEYIECTEGYDWSYNGLLIVKTKII
jgi:hypothetical protein